MYRNDIFPHEVRRALAAQVHENGRAARKAGGRVSNSDIQTVLQLLFGKLEGSPPSRRRRRFDQ